MGEAFKIVGVLEKKRYNKKKPDDRDPSELEWTVKRCSTNYKKKEMTQLKVEPHWNLRHSEKIPLMKKKSKGVGNHTHTPSNRPTRYASAASWMACTADV